jgi:RHS repeat-associated protein
VTLDQARFVAALFTKTADTPTTSYYHLDAQGSVRAISDDSGAIVIRHDYYTFGEDAQPLTGDPLRYAGKELDPETAQEYFGARYCRNVWGRFGTVDPIYSSAAVTDPQQWNRYAYARNNPLKFSDSLGLTCGPVNPGDMAQCTTTIDVSADSYFVATYYASGGGDTLDLTAVYHFDSTSGVGLGGGWCAEGYQPGVIYSPAHLCDEVPSPPSEPKAAPTQTSNVPSSDPPGDTGGGGGGGGGDDGSTKGGSIGPPPVNRLPWSYGNYCGPGGRGNAIDNTDAACQSHDTCYARNGFSASSNVRGPNAALAACNQALCDSVRAQAQSFDRRVSRGADLAYFDRHWNERQADRQIDFYFTIALHALGQNACH